MKHIRLMMAALAAVTMTFTAQAAKTAKAVVEDEGATLRFVYDETDYGAKDTDWFSVAEAEMINPDNEYVPWYHDRWWTVTKVVFAESFAAYQPTSVANWFYNFTKLTAVEGVAYWDTSKTTTFYALFANCSGLTTLNLAGLSTASAKNVGSMFNGCTALTTIAATDSFAVPEAARSKNMFKNCTSLVGGNGTPFNGDKTSGEYARIDKEGQPGYFTSPVAKVIPSKDGKTLRFVYDGRDYGTKDENWFSVAEAEAIDPYEGYVPWDGCGETVTNVVFDSSFAAYRPKQCGSWFEDFGVLAAVEGLANLNTSVATNMVYMFWGCEALTVLDVSGFDTANVTDMSDMFYGCWALESLDVSSFATSKVTCMSWMFGCCSSLTTLDVSGFNTANVTDMNYMFSDCSSLTTLDVSGFDTANVTSMNSMFYDCSSLTTIIASDKFVTGGVTSSDYMFGNCSNLVGGAGTKYYSAKTDREYARIDGGPSSATPGYFTTKQSAPYIVRYHKYDGSGTTRDQTVKSGAETRLLYMDSQLGWSRSGYEFVGWAPDPNSRLCKYQNGEKVKDLAAAGATVDLYATWLSPSSYRVCFHRNFDSKDETKLNQIVLRNTETVLAGMNSLIGWTRNGYTFMGWAETAGGTVKYANCAKVLNLSSIAGGTKHLYAVWKSDGKVKYTVCFHKYDGSGTTRSETYTVGVSKRLLYMDSQLKWSRSGYEFVGWAPDENSRLCKYLNGDMVLDLATANGATVHLYATWLSPSSYRVCFHRNFNASDATKLNQIVLRNAETVLAGMNNLIGWTRNGYTFMGWAETAGGAVKYANCAKVLNLSSIAGGTKHLYAVWKASQTVAPPVKPQTSSVKPQTSNLKLQTSNVKPQTSNLISGVFADGSGWFYLIVEEDWTAFFRAETEDGVWEAECEAEEVDDTLVLTFADAAPLVIRLESGAWVAE